MNVNKLQVSFLLDCRDLIYMLRMWKSLEIFLVGIEAWVNYGYTFYSMTRRFSIVCGGRDQKVP